MYVYLFHYNFARINPDIIRQLGPSEGCPETQTHHNDLIVIMRLLYATNFICVR